MPQETYGFRPLSRRPFFNETNMDARKGIVASFRPLSRGLSFNTEIIIHPKRMVKRFRPLSWGLSFNLMNFSRRSTVLVKSFRPLSWGLSFNMPDSDFFDTVTDLFSSPFLGTFFQLKAPEK